MPTKFLIVGSGAFYDFSSRKEVMVGIACFVR
jgi:hypothetical protein